MPGHAAEHAELRQAGGEVVRDPRGGGINVEQLSQLGVLGRDSDGAPSGPADAVLLASGCHEGGRGDGDGVSAERDGLREVRRDAKPSRDDEARLGGVLVEEGAGEATSLYDYDPDEHAILNDLLPRSVATQVFAALLENAASEQGARMTAMDNATRNAGDMINKLTIQFNRSRQAAITKELIEIISGAEAL